MNNKIQKTKGQHITKVDETNTYNFVIVLLYLHCLPCTIDGEKSSFILDTGSNTFLLPAQYLQQTKEIPVGIGEKEFMMTGSMCHAFVAKADSKGFWGRPLLNMFERLCFNFRDAHVEYVDK